MDTITLIRSRLNALKGQWPDICAVTGLRYDWLTRFAQGRIKEPGHSKTETLLKELDRREDREEIKHAA
ncbi:hypothetical protein [Solilutibacter silvestris]|uniref:hypothetical protein n=1 Tax=Solilutibacter silvestris TaxID=1645665 RepID=UPI003D332A98